ncbi:MAG: glycosyltransferase family 2 protein [Actinomycetota bacterium]|nr:glycosyltransferase family 2 protein [Actinomycetota bacterium]
MAGNVGDGRDGGQDGSLRTASESPDLTAVTPRDLGVDMSDPVGTAAVTAASAPPNVDELEDDADLLTTGPSFQPVKVLDVEIDATLSDIDGLDDYGSVQLLVRLHGAPLGFVRLPLRRGHISAGTIRDAILRTVEWDTVRHLLADYVVGLVPSSRSTPAALLEVDHPTTDAVLPSVTVAVCTRDRPEALARCLHAIAEIDYPALEVLIVDNAPSDDATRRMVAQRFGRLRYVQEPRPGLNWARNRAIVESRAEIIAFTDDDVVVDEQWVAALAGAFAESDEVMAVTGLVVPYELETQAQALFERYGGFGRGFKRQWYRRDTSGTGRPFHVGAGRFGTGANMAFRRHLFDEIGQFDPALDVGTATNGGGDLEMFFRVIEEGHTLAYEPSAIVRHCHRRDYDALRTQITNNGIGFYSFLVRSALAYPRRAPMLLRWGLWWLWWWSLRRLLISYVRPSRFPRELILAEFRGSLVGLSRYRTARREAARVARTASDAGIPAIVNS